LSFLDLALIEKNFEVSFACYALLDPAWFDKRGEMT